MPAVRVPLVLVAALVCVAAGGAGAARTGGDSMSLERLVGQRLVVALRGATPSPDMLARVRAGRVGGVVLFGGNVRSAPQVRALVARLQTAARAGGQPPLLVAVDQEGGPTRRFPWAPPVRSAAELGRLTGPALRSTGVATGRALRAVGVDVDLAPVVDVPVGRGSFIARQQRAFGTDRGRVGALAAAFADGLRVAGVAATAKHFPGLGRATRTTDLAPVTIAASRDQLTADLEPYRTLLAGGVRLVMLSNATYPALDGKPGAWSPAVEALLRRTLGFTGVTITDALDAAAATHGRALPSVGVLAAQSGADLLLIAGSEAVSDAVYAQLVAAAASGRLSRSNLERSYDRIVALKRTL